MSASVAALDPPTLLIVAALVIAFTGALMIVARGPRTDTPAVSTWGTAMIVAAAGLVTVRFAPPAFDTIAQLLFVSAAALSWVAARMFSGRKRRPGLAACGPAAWLAATQVASPAILLAAVCALGALYTIGIARELRATRAERLPSRAPAQALLLLHGAIYAGRGVAALAGLGPGSAASVLVAVLILESLLHTVGMGFLLMAMAKERVELRSVARVRGLALLDGLTGIGNRRLFEERLHTEFRRARRLHAPLALLLIDVDHFKAFNDAFGHPQGDACLRGIAQVIAQLVSRAGDVVARFGGEEFAVLLAETDLQAAIKVAETLRLAVQGLCVPHAAPYGMVTVSIGVAACVPRADDQADDVLIHPADRALYAAKAAGRNAVRAAGPPAAVPAAAA